MNFGFNMSEPLILPVEDYQPAARILPFDKQLSEVAYETATFGLG